jgi:membrane-associated protease RseP (regulator of RpoE activity)
MLDEMSSYEEVLPPADTVPQSEYDRRSDAIREAVVEVFAIETAEFNVRKDLTAIFTGQLLLDSEQAYEQLDARLASLDHLPVFREQHGVQIIQVMEGRFNPRPRPWWPNAVLLLLTVFSLLYTGAGIALGDALLVEPDRQVAELWRGWPYALGIVLILGSHELGHYFAARYHGVPVTLPYFIPLPFGFFGTLGAFIQLRAPLRNRKSLLDIGAAGPLAGMIFAVPILLIGLATAEVKALPTDVPYMLEGNSILYALAKIITFGRFLPDGRVDMFMNQLAQAGWTGLFITGLNLIPVGQLDGGHVIYTLLGERARWLHFPAVLLVGFLAFVVSDAWFLWVFLLMMFGRTYATPLDMITPLDNRRRAIAVLALVIFVLVFVPNPLSVVQPLELPPVEIF